MVKLRAERIKKLARRRHPEAASVDCLNCGDAFFGSYCPNCGQAASVQRYSPKTLGTEFYTQFRKIEVEALLITFLELIERPGKFVREYLLGKRLDYLGPVKYFFYAFILQIAAGYAIHALTGNDTKILTENSDLASQIIDLIATGFWGVCWWLAFRNSGLNLVENIVAALFFTGQTFMFTLILRLGFGPFTLSHPHVSTALIVVDMTLYLAYTFFFTYRLFNETGWRLLLKNLILILVYTVFIILLVLGKFLGSLLIFGAQTEVQPG